MTTLQTSYKFIRFQLSPDPEDPDRWLCFNQKSKDILCELEYYRPWRQWVMSEANPDAVFNEGCLRDVLHFMGQLKEMR